MTFMPPISSTLHSFSDSKKCLNSDLRLCNILSCIFGGCLARSYKCSSSENGSLEGFDICLAFFFGSSSSDSMAILFLFIFSLFLLSRQGVELDGRLEDEELPE